MVNDPLTGITDRNTFKYLAKERIDSGEFGLALVWFNIDNFKMYNNRFGFANGSNLLCELARILDKVFIKNDMDIVSRFSDDNFVVLTTWNDLEENIEKTENDLYNLHKNITLKLRAGIYFPSTGDVIDTACDRAKIACDSIRKNHSVTSCMYKEEMSLNLSYRQYILDSIDDAISRGDIEVFYQPIIRILTGNICETEALARWRDANLGFVSPGEFIPVLEQYREIHKLDTYTIRQVCMDYKKRNEKGLPSLPVSINLSRLDFELCDIYSEIEKSVLESGMPRDMLKIEITESVHGEDTTVLNLGIEKFRQNGYEVWMDDFGSGYSSLNVLKDYNFDTIKFDMKFLSGFTKKSEKAKYILSSNLSMAKQMGMQSLAEGVETPEQLEYLKTIGFEKAQGYLFGKPMSLDSIFELNLPIENFKDVAYYEKLGKIEMPNQDVMNHSGTIIADVRATALIEIINDDLKFLAENKTYRDWLNKLGDEKRKKLKKFFIQAIKNKISKDFYIFANGNCISANITPAANNPRTGAESWIITHREITHLPENSENNSGEKIYNFLTELFNGEIFRID